MNVLVAGISHHKTPVEIREKLIFPVDVLPDVLPKIKNELSFNELVVLSTCNRIEMYAVGEDTLTKQIENIKNGLSKYKNVPFSEFSQHLYFHHGTGAVKHLFRVASSLDSLVIGESQILGQVKEAYEIAHNAHCTGTLLNAMFQQSFNVAKNIRTSTNIAKGSISISSVAVELAEKIFGELKQKTVLIIGAGETGELTLKNLMKQGIQSIIVTNRNYERAVALATECHGQAVPFDSFMETLEDVDIVISSTSAPDVIIKKDHLQKVMRKRKNKPIFLIDIAVPRDIDSHAGTLDNVYLYNIDDLEQIVAQNRDHRTDELESCERIIESAQNDFLHWYSTLSITPLIHKLTERIEEIRHKEEERIMNQLPDLTDTEKEKIKVLTQRITGQIMHAPLENLKRQMASGNGYSYAEMLIELFELSKNGKLPTGDK